MATAPCRLKPPSREDGKRIRAFFDEVGYDVETLRGGLGFTDLASFRFRKYLLTANPEPAPLDVIVQWFTCGLPVSSILARRVIPEQVIDLIESCGLIVREQDQLRPTAMLSPFEDLLIASDLITKLHGDASDLIVWPNATTYQIRNASFPVVGGSMLDLGCGSGVLAVANARRCAVTATDINPRAAEFTAFNAALNGVDSVECIVGNCFEPVAGRSFDLILCNPPFFLVPSTGLLYCENPMELDLFARALMRQAPEHLNESGFFQMLCEWVDLAGNPWRQRIAEWSDGIGCDVWVIKMYTMSPNMYGKERCEQRPGGTQAADAAFANWVAYYRERGIEAVHGGLITLRRRSGTTWIRLDDNPTLTLSAPVGERILDGFTSYDLVQSRDDVLLSTRLRLLDKARLHQLLRRDGSKWAQSGLSLTVPGVFVRELEMQPLVAEFAGKFDGVHSLQELIVDLSKQVAANLDTVTKECLAITRTLLERGFLTKAVE